MGRVWRGLLEVYFFLRFAFAGNYGVLCLVAANGNFAVFHGCETRPVAEFCGRFNNRATKRNPLTDPDRFILALSQMCRTTPYSQPFAEVTGPNQLWCMDFKGWFRTGDGQRCDPFTITDAHSRYLIRCQAITRMDTAHVRAICESAMREYGVPSRIRTDNGAPFSTRVS
jgi:Integrase core domain